VKPAEAGLSHFHPIIIGLISQLIDSTDPQEILLAIRRLWSRGIELNEPPAAAKRPNTPKNGHIPVSRRAKAA